MQYRPATENDVAAIRGVAEASWDADYPAIVSRETATEAVEEWYGQDTVREAIANPLTVVLVAVDGDTVVGFAHALLSTGDWTGTVLRLYVVPDARRQGVGSELLERTVDALVAQGAERARAFVLADNDPGNEFYRSAGFEQVDTGETRIGGEGFAENVYVYDPD